MWFNTVTPVSEPNLYREVATLTDRKSGRWPAVYTAKWKMYLCSWSTITTTPVRKRCLSKRPEQGRPNRPVPGHYEEQEGLLRNPLVN